jgi:hypothetical protein
MYFLTILIFESGDGLFQGLQIEPEIEVFCEQAFKYVCILVVVSDHGLEYFAQLEEIRLLSGQCSDGHFGGQLGHSLPLQHRLVLLPQPRLAEVVELYLPFRQKYGTQTQVVVQNVLLH